MANKKPVHIESNGIVAGSTAHGFRNQATHHTGLIPAPVPHSSARTRRQALWNRSWFLQIIYSLSWNDWVRDHRHGSVPGVTHGRAKLCDQPRGGVVEDGRRLRTRERVAADGPG